MKFPKFNKDQWQKIILSVIMFCILIYGYFQFLLGPLNTVMENDTKAIADLQTKIEGARKEVKLGKNASDRAGASVATMGAIESMIPNEAVIAWFPPVISQFFAGHGINKITLKMKSTESVPGAGLEKFKFYRWDMSFPPVSALNALNALSDLENNKPLLSVQNIHIDANPDNPENQRVTCEFKTLLK